LIVEWRDEGRTRVRGTPVGPLSKWVGLGGVECHKRVKERRVVCAGSRSAGYSRRGLPRPPLLSGKMTSGGRKSRSLRTRPESGYRRCSRGHRRGRSGRAGQIPPGLEKSWNVGQSPAPAMTTQAPQAVWYGTGKCTIDCGKKRSEEASVPIGTAKVWRRVGICVK
jgi:hypothetical protein